jgi:hypothetical protein
MRVFTATLAAFFAMAGAALAAGGPLIPSGTYGTGPVGPGSRPDSSFRYVAVGGGDNPTVLERISTDGGRVTRQLPLDGSWALPAVTILNDAGGLSADGRTLVLVRPDYGRASAETKMLLVDTDRFRKLDHLTFDGTFSFDAVSPDGSHLYLVQYADPRDPLDYRVRSYDVSKHRFEPGSIVDPDEPDEKMTGQPVSRKMSPDGRWAYTLYGGGEETFIHALDTKAGAAQCVDLPGLERGQLYTLRLDVDRETGVITVLRDQTPKATVDAQTFEVTPVERSAPSVGTGGDGDASGDWVGFAGLAVGVGLLAGVAAIVVRHQRRAAA